MVMRSYWRPSREEVIAPTAMVTAMEAGAAEAGIEMLKKGGNAIDAAVAIGFCNIVLEPFMATIGGMGYMLVHLAEQGKTIALDFNGRAPRGATPDMYTVTGPAEPGGYHTFEVANDAHSQGALCVTVPGSCAGFLEAHRRWGKLPLEQVLEPAIQFASDGFEAGWHITLYAANDYEFLNLDRYLASMWLPDGHPPRSFPEYGDRIVQKDLGDLLRKIAAHGHRAMYGGEVAAEVERFIKDGGGVLAAKDLADYRPIAAKPLSKHYLGYDILAVPTPSGALTNLRTFEILRNFNMGAFEHNSADYLNLLIQASRHAFVDRFRYLGDWDQVPVPLEGLLSEQYNKEVAKLINVMAAGYFAAEEEEPWTAFLDTAAHDPWPYEPRGRRRGHFHPAMDDNDEGTTHFNVVDKDRNVVACTHTGVFTAGVNPPGTGVYLTGGMAWFVPKPGYANSIAPWKRPLNNMCPSIVLKNGKPYLCAGSPGARRIMNRNVQVLNNVLAFGMSPQRAIAAPTIDASGRDTLVNARIPDDVVGALRRLGHRIEVVEETPSMTGAFSRPSAILIDPETNLLHAGIDSYRPTMAIGY